MEVEKKSRPRSKAYPAMDLNDALKKTNKISENFGLNGAYNRETMATGMGYTSLSGTASRAIAALVHYGLLSRSKDQYELSVLAKKYLTPVEDDDIKEATREAAIRPSLFHEIYSKFSGQIIPKQFVNRLINEFGIQQNAASDVERIFRSTMETANILNENGILEIVIPSAASVKDDVRTEVEKSQLNSDPHTAKQTPKSENYQEIILNSGVKVLFPVEMSFRLAMGDFADALKKLDAVIEPKAKASNDKSDGGEEWGNV